MASTSGDAPRIGRDAHDDAELAAAETRAQTLKERFAFAVDERERVVLLKLASEATMHVNTMRAARECSPSVARRAADEARRVLANARRMLATATAAEESVVTTKGAPPKVAESRSPSVPNSRLTSSGASPARATSAASPDTKTPARRLMPFAKRAEDSPKQRQVPHIANAPVNVTPTQSSARKQSPEKERTSSVQRRSPPRETRHSPDVEHAAAVRLQRVQRGRAARERVRQISDAKRNSTRSVAIGKSNTTMHALNIGGDELITPQTLQAPKRVATKAPPRRYDLEHEQPKAPPRTKSAPSSTANVLPSAVTETRVTETQSLRSDETRSPKSQKPSSAQKATSAERAARAAAQRLKVKLTLEMSLAESAASAARLRQQRVARNREMMFPGEEKFYERLDHARMSVDQQRASTSARTSPARSRPNSASSFRPASAKFFASSPSPGSAFSTPISRSPLQTSNRAGTPKSALKSSRHPSAGGSSAASRSLRVSFEAASDADRAPPRNVSSAKKQTQNPHGSAVLRAEAAERALYAAEAAVAAARAEAERLRREALLPDDSESEYGSRYYGFENDAREYVSPIKSFDSPSRASTPTNHHPGGSNVDKSFDVTRTSMRSSYSQNRSGLGSSLSASIALDLDSALSAPATPMTTTKLYEDNFAFANSQQAPKSAPPKSNASTSKDSRRDVSSTTPVRSFVTVATPSSAPAEKTTLQRTTSTYQPPKSATDKAKAYSEGVRLMASKRLARQREADLEQTRRDAFLERQTQIADAKAGVPGSKLGATRALSITRDALLYSRDTNRRGVGAAFAKYYEGRHMQPAPGAFSGKGTNQNPGSVQEKELAALVWSMPGLSGLPKRFLPKLFQSCSTERVEKNEIAFHEGERADYAFLVVAGELGLFQKASNQKGLAALVPPKHPWNPETYPRKTRFQPTSGRSVGAEKFTQKEKDELTFFQNKKKQLLSQPGIEQESKLLGAPPGSGFFVKRLQTGYLFGLDAVKHTKPGEARACTGVALSDTTLLRISKQAFDDVVQAVRLGVDAQVAVFLRSTELFPNAEVTDIDLNSLASVLTRVVCQEGDCVVNAGDTAAGVFFVNRGVAEVFAKVKVLVDASWGGGVVDGADVRDSTDLRASMNSRTSSTGSLRRRTGTGGGAAAAHVLVERIRDEHLGDLVSPAVFGEECLFSAFPTRVGMTQPPGRHAFTVRAKLGNKIRKREHENDETRLVVYRLAPEDVKGLPDSVAKRLLQLAKSTYGASVEAMGALDAQAQVAGDFGHRDVNVVGSREFINAEAKASPTKVGVVFGSSQKPPPNLVDPSFEVDVDTKKAHEGRESSIRRSGIGLGGGGGRLRVSETVAGRRGSLSAGSQNARSPLRSPSGNQPPRVSPKTASSPYSRFMGDDRLALANGDEDQDESFERTAREVTEAALREAKLAERALREFRQNRSGRTRGVSAGTGAVAGSQNPQSNTSGAGAVTHSRLGIVPVVRLTKKHAAMAAKNAPPLRHTSGRVKGTTNRFAEETEKISPNAFRVNNQSARPATAGSFQFDANRARGVLEESNRVRGLSRETRASWEINVPSRAASAPYRGRGRYSDDFSEKWEQAAGFGDDA